MSVDIREEPLATLAEHGRISIAFEVDRVLECVPREAGLGGLLLTERRLATPYVKDYDVDAGEGPVRWSARFDLTNWGLLVARRDGVRVGGAVLAFDTPGVCTLDDRRDLAALWDLRVAPDERGRGVGHALFAAAEAWAAARGCRQLKVETQNVNVRACRFYMRQGCVLGAIHRHAYATLPDEVQLLWYRGLAPTAPDVQRDAV